MKPKDLIPKPCHENWSNMTGDERQRFCQKCSTHVHDITGMNTEEILDLKKRNGGKLCGALRLQHRLQKPLAVGTGIATLALAACSPEPNQQTSNNNQQNHTTPPTKIKNDPKNDTKTHHHNDGEDPPRLLGIICPPDEQPKDKPKEQPKELQPPALIGKVRLPDPNTEPAEQPQPPKEPEIILGDICEPPVPPKEPEPAEPKNTA